MRLWCLSFAATLAFATSLSAQEPVAPPVIDTIIFERHNVFEREGAGFFARAGNAIHVPTAYWVMRATILFRQGDTLNMLRVAESERTLRQLNVFQRVDVDTVTRDGKLAVVIRTRDAWSLSPKFSIAGSGGSLTLTLGLSEKNLLGTASLLSVAYVKLVDRDGLDFSARVPHFGRTRVSAGGTFQNLSVGNTGSWDAGVPYRAFPDPWSSVYKGLYADELRFRWRQLNGLDSLTYQHDLLSHRLTTSIAAQNSSRRYLRLGVDALLRTEEYVLQNVAPSPVEDSTTFTAGVTLDFRESKFYTGRFFQGFGQDEDIDLSPAVYLGAWLAPGGLGYTETGFGPEIRISAGKAAGPSVLVGHVEATGLINSSGLDSGKVVFRGTWASKLSQRTMAFIHVETGMMKGQAPGTEFDLGLTYGPRTFGAHAFVGDRTLWGTLEYRNYRWDDVLGFIGIGWAAFVDYGGAWYDGQEPRWGGNVGVGLRLGSSIGSKASAAKIDIAYRFGPDFNAGPIGVSFGASYDIFTGLLPPPP